MAPKRKHTGIQRSEIPVENKRRRTATTLDKNTFTDTRDDNDLGETIDRAVEEVDNQVDGCAKRDEDIRDSRLRPRRRIQSGSDKQQAAHNLNGKGTEKCPNRDKTRDRIPSEAPVDTVSSCDSKTTIDGQGPQPPSDDHAAGTHDSPTEDQSRSSSPIAMHMRRFLESRSPPKTFCPSEVARALTSNQLKQYGAADWRAMMPRIREVAWEMRMAGLCEIVQKGRVVGEEVGVQDVKGPVRIRRTGGQD